MMSDGWVEYTGQELPEFVEVEKWSGGPSPCQVVGRGDAILPDGNILRFRELVPNSWAISVVNSATSYTGSDADALRRLHADLSAFEAIVRADEREKVEKSAKAVLREEVEMAWKDGLTCWQNDRKTGECLTAYLRSRGLLDE